MGFPSTEEEKGGEKEEKRKRKKRLQMSVTLEKSKAFKVIKAMSRKYDKQ